MRARDADSDPAQVRRSEFRPLRDRGVFARIWSLREPGEQSEDTILRRVLRCEPQGNGEIAEDAPPPPQGGLRDAKFGVEFAEGFEIFRTYLGREYRARATGGRWKLEADTQPYASLNELSRAIGTKTENAWVNWFFRDGSGMRRPVSDLRDPNRITTRTTASPLVGHQTSKLERSTDNLDSHVRAAFKRLGGSTQAQATHEPSKLEHSTDNLDSDGTWRDDVRAALKRLSGRASLHRIYKETEIIRKSFGRSVPQSLEETVRRTLETHSSASDNYRGGLDLFSMPEGKGAGVWALREGVR
jgi:hypothetical protein